jgi:hypothetical protein
MKAETAYRVRRSGVPLNHRSEPDLAADITVRPRHNSDRTAPTGRGRYPEVPLSEASRKLDEAFARRWAAFKKGPTK